MIKKFLTYIFSIIILTGCSDSFEFYTDNTISPDGDIQFVLDIPGMVIPKSRSESEIDPEYNIENLVVLIYQGEGENSQLSQTEHFYAQGSDSPSTNKFERLEGENKIRISFRLNENLRHTSGLRFYVLANSPESNFSLTESNLKSQSVNSVKNENAEGNLQSLVMCGFACPELLSTTQNVSLSRNAAKVTVTNKIPTNNPEDLSYHTLYGNASESPRMTYMKELNIAEAQETIPGEKDILSSKVTYFHPTKNSEQDNGIGGKLFLITKAIYNGEEYYYRLDFVDKDSNGSDCYISALPNHWYQFVIRDVLCPGYTTPKEAALHPYNGVKYEIHDHSPVSFNMTSDGFRELGVSHLIEYSGLPNAEDGWSENEFLYVKLFSKDESEERKPALISISIKDKSWLNISEAVVVTEDAFTGGAGSDSDKNDKGTVYRFKLRFLQTDGLGSLENLITVRWMGLQREVPVTWTRNFTGSDVTSASLTMKYAGRETQIENYWNFLTSTDETSGNVSNALWGIQTAANNGKIRNQGFHFPVMYGSSGNLATYSYVLTFDQLVKLKKTNVAKVVVNNTDSHVTVTCNENQNDDFYSYTITRDNNDEYNYSVNDITFTFYFKDNSTQDYTFHLYHTGFFHKDSQSHRLDVEGKDTENYYYYEVVPVTVDGQKRYMLDRNLAAKSAEMYVRDESGNTVLGNPDAAGGYFTVAYQQLDENGNNTYNDPVMFDDTDDRVSPPGYRIPLKNAWGAIRTSSNFHNEAVNGLFPAYYDTGNPIIGKVYFPKSMLFMYDSGGTGSIKGDGRSGYYWTGTAATGTEKDEIGKWLNMFTLTGSSTSYVNGCVVVRGKPNLEYGASVRCINDVSDNSTTSLTSFNVTGATHVFLYKEDSDGVRTATTAWPGHAVGNYATMTDGRWFGFSFESTQFSPEELYVIFNFVDQDGIIYTYSCDKNNHSTILTTHLTPSQCVGWKVIDDINGHIKPGEPYETIDGIKLMPADKTALKNWWRCGGRKSSPSSPYVWDYQLAPKSLYMVGDATPGNWEINSVTEVSPDLNNSGIYTWEGTLTIGELKATFSTVRDDGFWSAYFLRPVVNQTQISRDGLTDSPMGEWKEKDTSNDYKWKVVTRGRYRLSFNMNKMTFSAECLEEIPEGTITITVTNDQNWEDVYLYYWNSAGNYGNSWPGTKMNRVDGTDNRFYLDIPEYSEKIIFNNGNKGKQTKDIKLNGIYDFGSLAPLM